MTINEALFGSYGWADENAGLILLASVVFPIVGTVAAKIGKGGKTDADGRMIASAVIGVALVAVALEFFALFIARAVEGKSLLDANLVLILAPLIALGGSAFGIRMIFPLSELGSVRTAADLFIFLLALGGIGYFFSKFHGWGIIFFGSFTQLVVVLAVAFFFMWRLFRRAMGMNKKPLTPRPEGWPVSE